MPTTSVCPSGWRSARRIGYRAEPSVGITFHDEAHNTSVGGQVFVDGSYVTSLQSLANEGQVKRRFLDRFEADPDRSRSPALDAR